MKNRCFLLTIITAIMICAAGIVLWRFANQKPPAQNETVQEFSLSQYKSAIEEFPHDENVGSIDSYTVAVEKAKTLWIKKFSTDHYDFNPSTKGKGTLVFYDSLNHCWFIKGTLPPDTKGSVPCAIIQDNGQVLAVWMD